MKIIVGMIIKSLSMKCAKGMVLSQHHLKTRPSQRSLATSQTSELVGKALKTCNSYPDAIFK